MERDGMGWDGTRGGGRGPYSSAFDHEQQCRVYFKIKVL